MLHDLSPKLAVSTFSLLKKYAGWQMFLEVAEANAESLRDSILKGLEDEDTIKAKRQKLHAYEEILSIPDKMIEMYREKEGFQDENDPYDVAED